MAVTLIQAALTLSLTLQDSEEPDTSHVSSSNVQATLSCVIKAETNMYKRR